MICEDARKVDIRSWRGAWVEYYLPSGNLVAVTLTRCHLGGLRQWWVCPRCGRRCLILYPSVCRICAKGRYAVESMTPLYRAMTKAYRLRRRLGQKCGGLLNPFPGKPKGMHWSTYYRLEAEGRALEATLDSMAEAQFGLAPLPEDPLPSLGP